MREARSFFADSDGVSKVNDLREKVGLARVYIPPYIRVDVFGNVQNVDGYWRDVDLSPDDRAPDEGRALAVASPEVSVRGTLPPSPYRAPEAPQPGIPFDRVAETDSLRSLVNAPTFGSGDLGPSVTGWRATSEGASHLDGIELALGPDLEKPYEVRFGGVSVRFEDKSVAADYAKLLVADDGRDKPSAEHLNYLNILDNFPERLGVLPTAPRKGRETFEDARRAYLRKTARDKHLEMGQRRQQVADETLARILRSSSSMDATLARYEAQNALDEMLTLLATRMVRAATPRAAYTWLEGLFITQYPAV